MGINYVLMIATYCVLKTTCMSDMRHGYVAGGLAGHSSSLEQTKALFEHIFTEYDIRLRPRINQSETVVVNATFVPNAIVNFDTTGQRIDVMGYFRVLWTDDLMKWNASEFGGADDISVPLKDIWYPQLIVNKAYKSNGVVGDKNMDVVRINKNGEVRWVPNGHYGFICDVEVQFYPNDVQKCDLQFYVTDQPASKVELTTPTEVPLNHFTENSEWGLVRVTSSVNIDYGAYIASVRFEIERRASFTVFTIVVPLLTLSILSIFTFIVPVECGEKGSLSITIFLAYGFFIAITRDFLPHNSLQIPYFVSYICVLLILSVFTVLYVMIETKIYYTMGTKPCNLRLYRLKSLCHKSNKIKQWNQKINQSKPNKIGNKEHKTTHNELNKTSVNLITVRTSDQKTNSANREVYTWADFLRLTNVVLFSIIFIFLFVFSLVLGTCVVYRQC